MIFGAEYPENKGKIICHTITLVPTMAFPMGMPPPMLHSILASSPHVSDDFCHARSCNCLPKP
jgi:hypothetical protein